MCVCIVGRSAVLLRTRDEEGERVLLSLERRKIAGLRRALQEAGKVPRRSLHGWQVRRARVGQFVSQ
jgi:hypothetical protein